MARIEFDERDNILVGRILGLGSIISFHGETIAPLRREFAAAFKDCPRDCEEQGVEPEKPTSGRLLLLVLRKPTAEPSSPRRPRARA